MKATASTDFATMLNELARPEAFPHAPSGKERVSIIQTHASAVLLVSDRAYKLKKPKDFGFFDYSTPALRRHFCGQEVRGKVQSFQLDEPEVPQPQRELARETAQCLFAQAAHYAGGPTRPALLLISGLMGTGKSTLALALQRELGWALFSSDTTRKRLAHLDLARPQADAFGQGMYGQAWTARAYRAVLSEADGALASGRSVLLDASFLRRADRREAARIAGVYRAHLFFVECGCPREVALKRLSQRWKQRTEGSEALSEEAIRASDGRPDLYDAQCAVWEPFASDLEPGTEHMAITTTLPLVVNIEQALDALQMPRFACWL